MPLIFITGPVRSGKSRFAQSLATESGLQVDYLATSERDPSDLEWSDRIDRHRADRPKHWRTVETAPLSPAHMHGLFGEAEANRCLLFDAVGTWLGSAIGAERHEIARAYPTVQNRLEERSSALVLAMLASPALVVVVCEQVGWDVVPVEPSARLFRDAIGRIGQQLAQRARDAYLVVGGYAIDLHAVGRPIASALD